MSRAFRNTDSPGSIYDCYTGEYGEPNPDERERALGYNTGATAAPGVTQLQRHEITGNCMDQAGLSSLVHFAMCHIIGGAPTFSRVHTAIRMGAHQQKSLLSLEQLPPTTLGSYVAHYASHMDEHLAEIKTNQKGDLRKKPDDVNNTVTDNPVHPQVAFNGNKHLCRMANEASQTKDIHHDADTLHFLRTGRFLQNQTSASMKRIRNRAANYHITDSPATLHRKMANGTWRVVPAPAERQAVINNAHTTSGHFGIRRTMHLMLVNYWWQGIWADVTKTVNNCKVCDRVKASFNASHQELHPCLSWVCSIDGELTFVALSQRLI